MKAKLRNLFASAALVSACVGAPNFAAAQVVQDNVLGTFLVFTKFDIRADTSTQLRIVNNQNFPIDVQLNYVCPGIKHVDDFCDALDTEVTFTPYQTRIIDVADQNPPCNQGYVVAFPISGSDIPFSYNFLSGSWTISQGQRSEADNAIAVQSARAPGVALGGSGKLTFGGGNPDFVAMPSNLYTDFRAVAFEPDTGSRINLLTLDINAGMQNPPAFAQVDFWNSAEVPYSSSLEFICWTELQLDEIDNNFLEENLGTTYGQMIITPFPNCPVPGTCPPLPVYDATMLGSITEYADSTLTGRNMFHDTTPKATAYQPS